MIHSGRFVTVFATAVLAVPLLACGADTKVAQPNGTSTSKVAADHVTVELIGETSAFVPGLRAWLGLKFTHEPHWHTYWTNPGDSGLPTKLEWQLPNGFRAGEIVWPAPKRFDLGDLFNFGYENTSLLMVPIDVPANAAGAAPISVNARWLICNDVCIPGKATLALTLPIAKQSVPHSASAELFAKSRASVPVVAIARGSVEQTGERIRVEVESDKLPKDGVYDFFPAVPKLFTNAPFKVSREGNRTVLTGVRSEYFESAPATLPLVVTRTAGGTTSAWQFDIPWLSKTRTSATK